MIVLQFTEIQAMLAEREAKLAHALAYFTFLRECQELQDWMNDQQVKAASEDYGTDVEHVELLAQAFETIFSSLHNSTARVEECIQKGTDLIETGSNYSGDIKSKVTEIRYQWEDLLELANARQEALAGAKQVHMFDRTAEETIAWIQEKAATLSVDFYGQDLESTQTLIREHVAFESELNAVRDQVEAIELEAEKLIETFPDAEEHITVKKEDTQAAWDELKVKSAEKRHNLQQAEQLQSYYDHHQEFL